MSGERVKFRQPYDPTQFMNSTCENFAASISKHHLGVDKMNRQGAILIAACCSGVIENLETMSVEELDEWIEAFMFSLRTGTQATLLSIVWPREDGRVTSRWGV